MAMNLRPNHPVGQVLGRLAEQLRAVPTGDVMVPNVQVTGVTLRGQNAQTGDLFAALPGASSHGGRYAADAVAHGAVAVLTDAAGADAMRRRRRGARARPSRPAVGLGRIGRHRLRASVGSAARHRRHRNVRQDHDDVSGGGRPAIGGAGRRADRHCRRPHRRTRSAQRADHTRGTRSTGAAGGDGRTGRRHRGDGGLQPRADAGSRRWRALRGRRIHQSVAGPPRLPPDDAGLLRRQGSAVRP